MKFQFLSIILLLTLSTTSNAVLLSRLEGQAVYDTDRDITWLANANLAATNTFGITQSLDVVPVAGQIGSTGKMNWHTANDWIDAMNTANYLEVSTWRLPTTLDPDTSCHNSPIASNGVDFKFTDSYLSMHYRFITGIFTFDPGITIHSYKTENTQLGNLASDSYSDVRPDMRIFMKFKSSESLRFTYRATTQFTDVNKLALGYVFNNYNSFFQGNPALEAAKVYNYSLNYQSINIFTNRKHKTEHLLEALQYLSGSRVHILDVVFQLLDDSGEFINLKNKDVKDARYTGVLINPNTGEQVDNFEQKVHMVFAPNLSELKKHYG